MEWRSRLQGDDLEHFHSIIVLGRVDARVLKYLIVVHLLRHTYSTARWCGDAGLRKCINPGVALT